MAPLDLQIIRGAVLSECRTFRYVLTRTWGPSPPLTAVGLNPSTADDFEDDATTLKLMGIARRCGSGGLVLLNAYAYRARDPKRLAKAEDPIGPDNDPYLACYLRSAFVLVGWGARCDPERAAAVMRLIPMGQHAFCLGRTANGQPKHPLYVPYETLFVPHPAGS